MLSQLYIKNVAVISKATIAFTQGLNVFTGETGAGKSILINAINAVLGERTSKDIIRTNESKAEISALFTDLDAASMEALEQAGYGDEDGNALLSREISADGKSVCRINGRPATVSLMREISSYLINVHGQHDNQQLLSAQKHLGFIDAYGELEGLREQYHQCFEKLQEAKNALSALNVDEAEKAHRIDLLRYQIDEIEQAELSLGEEEALQSERKLLKNSVAVTEALGGSVMLLDGDDESAGLMAQLSDLSGKLETVSGYMQEAASISDRVSDMYYELEGYAGDLRRLLDGFEFDPLRMEEIEGRLNLIYGLKKKYGSDIDSILQFYANAQHELQQIETSEERALLLEKEVSRLTAETEKRAEALSKARKKAADGFAKAVGEELHFLDMPAVRLSVCMQRKPLGADGWDTAELMISANVGEGEKSLSKIASGGELSRIMLSIKNVMANQDRISTMIFDEIDTGVSGRAAQKIGKKLAQVACARQVIVITHLAQVAAYASNHFFISKTTKESRTFTSIASLEHAQRVEELARMTAGEHITEAALQHSEELLREAAAESGAGATSDTKP